MNTGKTLFAQLMDFLPWTRTFARYVARYDGDKGVRTLTCAERVRVMAFAQLTYRESLRDIETCLRTCQTPSSTTGLSANVSRRTTWPMRTSRATGASIADFAQMPDPSRTSAVRERNPFGVELEHTALRARFHHHRPLPVLCFPGRAFARTRPR